jgi:Uma2 family endonuclease
MSQPATALKPLPFELVYSDGEPLETEWHALQLPFLWHLIRQAMVEQGRRDFYVCGDMFVYYSVEQAWDVYQGKKYFRGPDVFWVDGAEPDRERKCWVAWEEGGRLPDVIVELSSPSTAEIDRKDKKKLYSEVWGTREYFIYDPDTRVMEGFRLLGRTYRPLVPDAHGRFWSEQLGASLGLWHGVHEGRERDWVRLFRLDGTLVPSANEQAEAAHERAEAEHQRAEAEHQRAEMERRRAETAETELARLRALLEKRNPS